ncbi:MAG: excinuclease ABC subunit UvrA [Verrucomicrobiota bacterium]
MPSNLKAIRLKGVRQNNLKNFDLDIPIGKMTVVTGLSGAGKSSLVFDTLHAEGQRRYVETFNAYTRQFLEMMPRPDVDEVENIRPSIALEQKNSVRASRSTVGTMTELCDFFKAWFPTVATLYDPASGKAISDDSPQSIWASISEDPRISSVILVAFAVARPKNISWGEIVESLKKQGYTRIAAGQTLVRLDTRTQEPKKGDRVYVIQDRLKVAPSNRNRFFEAASTAFLHGQGELVILSEEGKLLESFSHGLRSPVSGRVFRRPQPALFSFNSPIGACPTCRGFGRVIGLNRSMVIPDTSLSLNEGAIRAFQGKVYSNSLDDLRRQSKRANLRMDVPWAELTEKERRFVWEGDPDFSPDEEDWSGQWYGIERFFGWLERNVYKMHVRIFLSKYRSYDKCTACDGKRLGEESMCWKWQGFTLPDLYDLEVSSLRRLLADRFESAERGDLLNSILQRLGFLDQVGLGYLTLNRQTRTLSGGETERVNLTTCLGTSMVETLFVLDEPSVGLHPQDIDRLTAILRGLVTQGNTVVVVEHDERIMRAADRLIEIGPKPGKLGGKVTFAGSLAQIQRVPNSLTGQYLSGKKGPVRSFARRKIQMDQRNKNATGRVSFYGASKHNLREVNLHLPLNRFVAISGVSGSGKSTLLQKVIYEGLTAQKGTAVEDPAIIRDIDASTSIGEVVRIDQSSLSKTPRSNPAVLSGAWEDFRKAFAKTDEAMKAGMTASTFSFNTGDGRCEHCQGLGYEQVEMQFLSDLYLPCPVCDGKRFKPEVLAIQLNGFSVHDLMQMEVNEVLKEFAGDPSIVQKLEPIQRVGLGYLSLGHPLNQLSGGESQRLKLVKHLGKVSGNGSLILIDEPTTGLHRHDITNLLSVFEELVEAGNSLVVVEHHPDILCAADWLIEMGPGAGSSGGEIVAAGTPEEVASGNSLSAAFLRDSIQGTTDQKSHTPNSNGKVISFPKEVLKVAESQSEYGKRPNSISIEGASEHNLRDVYVKIPHGRTTVVSGVSGSGKSTLAFDIVFAEGQRRFLESMSAYARQFVEQLPKPSVEKLTGLAPSVAIEQRVTSGTAKSTVATITEVAQFLRLLYARIGVQHNPETGNPVEAMAEEQLVRLFHKRRTEISSRAKTLFLGSPLVRSKKGHHQPIADWAGAHDHPFLICDGRWISPEKFEKLDRYREHDVDVVLADISAWDQKGSQEIFSEALKVGNGTAFLQTSKTSEKIYFSRTRVDPETGESFPDLDPKHFSWNSPKGWCPTCRGRGTLLDEKDENGEEPICPDCKGARLGEMSRNVFLDTHSLGKISFPKLLSLRASEVISVLSEVKGGPRERAILAEILPEIRERLIFMEEIGLDYLTLDRPTRTLSGGEAQRIRLTSQLGSNLTGVLYVLDEPTIGLHTRDNEKLLQSIDRLKSRGNTVLVVEHDADVILNADRVIDVGPGAGVHGGNVVAEGTPAQIIKNRRSETGKYLKRTANHPLRGSRRELPEGNKNWIRLEGIQLRNWKGGSVAIPRRRLTAVCGVSGAGKSTLVHEAILRSVGFGLANDSKQLGAGALKKIFGTGQTGASLIRRVSGFLGIRKVIEIDQSPIGKTSRSTPATYIGVFDKIRNSFASLTEAKVRGLHSGSFSFNSAGGRCETCKGAGVRKLEMNFLPNASVVCEECEGKRYRDDLLEILWRDRSIADVLEMSFEEAADFFYFDNSIQKVLQLMVETGLGYLKLGQPSPTLSGGEAQRLKLVSELAEGGSGSSGYENLYLLEEPTIGLHLKDCERLTGLLHRLVDDGHTVIVIEHQANILAEADYLLEIGPEGGSKGGQVIHAGTPEEIVRNKKSPTGPSLRQLLSKCP